MLTLKKKQQANRNVGIRMEGEMTEGVVSFNYQDTGRLQKLSNLSSCSNNSENKHNSASISIAMNSV